jgi:nucleotide-binding universal stress UspA family protein
MATMPIVACVDGSEESLRAAEWAAREAQRRSAPLRLVSAAVMPPRMHAHSGVPRTVADALRGESVRALSAAVARAEEVSSRLLIDASVLAGPPAVTVTASGSGALMLVVGARGAGGFAAMLLGSVSRYAAMHAPCPVIVVREETCAVHGEVVVGIRDPLDISAALGLAFDEAAVRGAGLVAVHCWNGLSATFPGADSRQLADGAERNLAKALAPWRDKYPGVNVRCDVVPDHPGHVLASYTGRADLMVIGRQRHGGVGGVQHALLNHAHGPVAVIPRQS